MFSYIPNHSLAENIRICANRSLCDFHSLVANSSLELCWFSHQCDYKRAGLALPAPVRSQFTGALIGLAALSDVGKGQYWCCMRRLSPLTYPSQPLLTLPPPNTYTYISRCALTLLFLIRSTKTTRFAH